MLETLGALAAAAAATLGRLEAAEDPEVSDVEQEGLKAPQEPTTKTAEEPTTPEKKCKDQEGEEEEEGAKTPEEPQHPAAQQPETPKKPRTPRADVYLLAESGFEETEHHVEWAKLEPTKIPTTPKLSDDDPESPDTPSLPVPTSSPEDPPSDSPSPTLSPPSPARARHSRHPRRLKPAPTFAVCCHTHVTHSGCTHTESSVGRICRNVDLCAEGILNNWQQLGDCDMCDDSKNLQWDMSSGDEGEGGSGWESDDDDDEEEEEEEGEEKEGEEVVVVVVEVVRQNVVGADKKTEHEEVTDSPAGYGLRRSSWKKRAHDEDGEEVDPEEAQRRKRRVSFNETLQVQYLQS
ncbi:hypothetical protein DFP73DRAFT_404927 [Morchella snyderi]|nr:hypothetical protein DFP73DRAFT_404927 [Morchella snyderi]